jgi:hypothetical protein
MVFWSKVFHFVGVLCAPAKDAFIMLIIVALQTGAARGFSLEANDIELGREPIIQVLVLKPRKLKSGE